MNRWHQSFFAGVASPRTNHAALALECSH